MPGQIHQNGITELKTYDAAGQLLAHEHRKDGALVGGHGYTLDLAGRRSAETFLGDTGTPARSYGYDLADQVTSASYGAGQADSYAYDAMGNRESATLASLGGITTQYTANNANQYTSISGWPAPVHDANGNLLQRNGVTYTWDSENRLLSLQDATRRIEFTYDGLHRRVTKKVVLLAGSIVESQVHYLYDGWNPIRETSLLTPAQRTDYTWGIDLSGSLQGAGGVGGLLLAEVSDGSGTIARHFHYDGNGNVTEVTDLAGNNLARYRYDAFGNPFVATGAHATANKYRFSTKPLDNEIPNAQLYYYGYRYYDPTTGRWPSRDPIGEKGGVNLYGFLRNVVFNTFDLLGLEEITVDRCQAYIRYDHWDNKNPIEWNFNGKCALGGFIGCKPNTRNPPHAVAPNEEGSKLPADHRIPNVPDHGELMLVMDGEMNAGKNIDGGDNGGRNKENVDDEDPSNEHSMPHALDNVTSPENVTAIMEKLCECCQDVEIIIELGTDDSLISGIDKWSQRWKGRLVEPNIGGAKFSKTLSCEQPESWHLNK